MIQKKNRKKVHCTRYQNETYRLRNKRKKTNYCGNIFVLTQDKHKITLQLNFWNWLPMIRFTSTAFTGLQKNKCQITAFVVTISFFFQVTPYLLPRCCFFCYCLFLIWKFDLFFLSALLHCARAGAHIAVKKTSIEISEKKNTQRIQSKITSFCYRRKIQPITLIYKKKPKVNKSNQKTVGDGIFSLTVDSNNFHIFWKNFQLKFSKVNRRSIYKINDFLV